MPAPRLGWNAHWLWSRRNPKFAAALTALALSLVVGSVLFGTQYRRTLVANHNLRSTVEFMANLFSRVDPAKDGRKVTVMSQLDQGLRQIRTDSSMADETKASLAFSIGVAYIGLGLHDQAIEAMQMADHVWSRKHAPDSLTCLRTKCQLGLAYQGAGQLTQAADILAPAAELASQHLGQTHATTRNLLNCLAITYGELGDYEKEFQIMESLYTSRNQEQSPEGEQQILLNYADALCHVRRIDEAIPIYEASRRIFAEDDFRTLQAGQNLSTALLRMGRYEEATSVIEQSLPICRDLLGENHSQTLGWENNLAGVLMTTGKYERAVSVLAELLPKTQQSLGENHPDALKVEINLGGGHLRLNQPELAAARFAAAHHKLQTQFGVDHPLTAKSLRLLGQAKTAAGQYAEAESIFRELIAAEGKKPAPNDQLLAQMNWRLAINLAEDERAAEAAEVFRLAVDLYRVHKPECWQIADAKSRLGELLHDQGQREEGRALLKEGRQQLEERRELIEASLRESIIQAAEERLSRLPPGR